MHLSETSELCPGKFLAERIAPEESSTYPDLLILNQPITQFAAFSRLWKHTRYRICADGGANRLFDMFQGDMVPQRNQFVWLLLDAGVPEADRHQLPDAIHGDLDSLRNDVGDYYVQCGVEVSRDPDQYSTDFGKTMQKLSSRLPASSLQDVLILGTLGGRVDQGLGLLHEMIREETKHPNMRLWLFSECSLSFILPSRRNIVRGLQTSGVFTENLGLVPIYGPAVITTAGLEWDVKEWETQMGGQVSTSNHVKADEVEVETDAPILFTIERKPLGGGQAW